MMEEKEGGAAFKMAFSDHSFISTIDLIAKAFS